MAAEATQAPAVTQSANGQATGPVEPPCEDCATASEKFMGLLGIAAAVGLAFIGIDLVTGGALSRVLFAKGGPDASGE